MSRDFRILGFEELQPEDACEFLAQAGARLKRLYKRVAELEARAEKAEALWQLFETAPKSTATQVIYILITDGVCLPDIVTWKPARPEYIDAFATKWLERPEGWFGVDGVRSRLDSKATHWMRLPEQPARVPLKEQDHG